LAAGLVVPPAQDAWKSHSDPRLVTPARLDAFKADLEHQLGVHLTHRPEDIQRMAADIAVDFTDLCIAEP
jgi:hypothetical protein